ncbi:MAG: DAK2 domain-containing protein, partial [Acidimicrobiales bacterium]
MNQLAERVDGALERLAESAEELRSLDAAIGDGDLGITVSKGVAAARKALAELSEQADVAQLLQSIGSAFASANPSTFAALVGGAVMSAARVVSGASTFDRKLAVLALRAAADSIATRGKAQLGDKTMLDALYPSVDALE